MSNDTMARGGRAPSLSWVVLVGVGLVVGRGPCRRASPLPRRATCAADP